MMTLSNPLAHVTIIVPTLNEVENIEPLLAGIFQQTSTALSLDVLFVDDGSIDGTCEKILSLATTQRVRLLERTAPEDGLAGAVLAGARAVSSEWIVVMDADLSHPPDQLDRLLRPLLAQTSDMVIGSRYAPGGRTPGWPRWRRWMSRAASLLAWPLTSVRDPLAGFFSTRRQCLIDCQAGATGFKIGLELIVRSGRGFRVREIPIVFRDRTRGVSKMRPAVLFTYLRRLFVLTLHLVAAYSDRSALGVQMVGGQHRFPRPA